MVDMDEQLPRFEAWRSAQEAAPAHAEPVTTAEMIRWVQQSLNERRRRAERQMSKDWKRTTPHRAARVVEVGNALLRRLREAEAK